jgi:hypothetical protein
VNDLRADGRFTTGVLPDVTGSVSYLAASVLADGRTWGRLVVADTGRRHFSGSDVESLCSIAGMLAAALRRKRQEWAQAGVVRLTAAHEPMPTQPDTEVALVDRAGVIVWVNPAWKDFSRQNGGDPARTGVGMSYLDCCDKAHDPLAEQVAAAIRTAVQGDLPAPMTILIPCHSSRAARWFDVLISSRLDDQGTSLGPPSPCRSPFDEARCGRHRSGRWGRRLNAAASAGTVTG